MPTTNLGMTLPTEDGSSGVWDTLLIACLNLIDSHDHSSGKGVTVKTAGISINADLPFGGFAATGMKAIDFTPVAEASVSALAAALFVSDDDDDLYFRTVGGVNVKIISGTSLNAALLAGFTGDYGAGDEQAEYTSGTSIYDFRKDDTTRAFLDTSDIRLFEGTSGVSTAVKLKSPASLAGSYTMTMPAALPGSTSLVMLSAAGLLSTSLTPTLTTLATTGAATLNSAVVTTSATVGTTLAVTGTSTLAAVNASGLVAMAGAATVGTTLGVTGAATLGSTLGVTGLITATAGVTAAANQHLTVSGTGIVKHGSRTIYVPGAACEPLLSTSTFTRGATGPYTLNDTHVVFLRLPDPCVVVGARLQSITVYIETSGNTGTRGVSLVENGFNLVGSTVIGSDTDATTSNAVTLVISAMPYTIVDAKIYSLIFDLYDDDIIRSIGFGYDQP